MTDALKIQRVQLLLMNDAEATDDVVTTYLDMAKERILERRYPYATESTVRWMPTRFDNLQIELAARMFSRRGGLGELIHNENGINRAWDSSDDSDLLSSVLPVAKVVG